MTEANREQELVQLLAGFESVLVAFSGGVDSSYLAFTAHRVLGERALAVTAISPSVSRQQQRLARDFAQAQGLNHRLIRTGEMQDARYTDNPVNRCYFCKTELYRQLEQLRGEWRVEIIVDGTNADDLSDHRPGRLAARERAVRSPLAEVGLSKQAIRELSKKWGLSSWDQPAMPCLSSRLPYGVKVTRQRLQQVELAEAYLRALGFKELRVRHHNELARIEVASQEVNRLLDPALRARIEDRFKQIGYRYVAMDLGGLRSGSLNPPISKPALPFDSRTSGKSVYSQPVE